MGLRQSSGFHPWSKPCAACSRQLQPQPAPSGGGSEARAGDDADPNAPEPAEPARGAGGRSCDCVGSGAERAWSS